MDEHKLLHELYLTFITTNEQIYLRVSWTLTSHDEMCDLFYSVTCKTWIAKKIFFLKTGVYWMFILPHLKKLISHSPYISFNF